MIKQSGESRQRWHRWEELKRHEIAALAPEALVVIPVGAIEQHGPYLPTGTDITLSTRVVELALDRVGVRADAPFLFAPFLRIGCSAHHLPFGGTISLSPKLMIDVLVEAMLSMTASGVRRIVLVNGHGGNTGVCHAAASDAAARSDLVIAAVDYWEFASAAETLPQPGHAGWFETSLMLAARPDCVAGDREPRPADEAMQPGRGIYGREVWAGIDGYTDQPASATADHGSEILEGIVHQLADRLVGLAQEMR
ncbi:creatininase family protein [Modestobacter sp. VKM Ac-2979]|uniref:creatininase family protein n=1 Tax=unclassified Modestobacter TaxID=2643866 RepID=UPI0022ABA5E2|nr:MULTISPECIES: creatininase family protein [unclassified Modestobacter]MCZ2811989.1 creatininase family protein [Modestobacter sp. VKM Ac-2979]MCZ2843713.1 creatininase family protein [Modestobacter sp. VKM Ac-2980]